ncbi:MAG: hypothetical protein ACI9U6_000022 [Loktanella salsilacus]|jgi:hypothetical protein
MRLQNNPTAFYSGINMEKTMIDITSRVKRAAKKAGYSKADILAGIDYYERKNRITNPKGFFDKAGRFYAKERTQKVLLAREPSRAFPYSEMKAARTADHCAELYGATPLYVKRICKAFESDGTNIASILKTVKKLVPA